VRRGAVVYLLRMEAATTDLAAGARGIQTVDRWQFD
jgi:hypothetical protein